MRLLLASTPFSAPTSPPFGLACLKAAIDRSYPAAKTSVTDWNLAFFRRWLLGDPPLGRSQEGPGRSSWAGPANSRTGEQLTCHSAALLNRLGRPDLVPPLAAESAGLEPSIRTALRTELLRASAMLDNQPATIALAEESLRDGSDLDGLYYALGRSYENAGRHAEALGAFRQAEIRDWYELEFSRAQARCLRSLGRSGEAQEMEAKAQRKEEFHGGMGLS